MGYPQKELDLPQGWSRTSGLSALYAASASRRPHGPGLGVLFRCRHFSIFLNKGRPIFIFHWATKIRWLLLTIPNTCALDFKGATRGIIEGDPKA